MLTEFKKEEEIGTGKRAGISRITESDSPTLQSLDAFSIHLSQNDVKEKFSLASVPNAKAEAGININDKSQPFTDLILNGKKTVETRTNRNLDDYIGQRIGIVRTGRGKQAQTFLCGPGLGVIESPAKSLNVQKLDVYKIVRGAQAGGALLFPWLHKPYLWLIL